MTGEDAHLEAAYEERFELYDEASEMDSVYCDWCGYHHPEDQPCE